MKKLTLFMIALLAFNVAFAQEHMKFKGVEMSGSVKTFVKQLEAKGLRMVASDNNVYMLAGDFAGFHDCGIGVGGNDNGNVVKVVVVFPEQDSWTLLYGNYKAIKDMLVTKYGDYTKSVERWEGYSEPRDDKSRMYEVSMDRCRYATGWDSPQGTIELSIEHDHFKCYVMLSYYDKLGQAETLQSAIDDL